ncbi:MAG: ribonuclease P protein component [Dokdonella sp.]
MLPVAQLAGDARFPANTHLRKAADFAALRVHGKRCGSEFFHAEAAGNTLNFARIGLAVSRRVSKRAVDRNRIKRVVRESFRHKRQTLPPLDVLVIARSSARITANHLLRGDLDRLWQRLRTLKLSAASGTMRADTP